MLTITSAQFRAGVPAPRKPSKYRNKPTYLVGTVLTTDKDEAQRLAKVMGVKIVRFASYAEATRDGDLHLLQKAGKIRNLKRQPRFPLVVNDIKVCTYVGDWSYEEARGEPLSISCIWEKVCEDRKGAITPAFKIKFALVKALHPEIEWRLS